MKAVKFAVLGLMASVLVSLGQGSTSVVLHTTQGAPGPVSLSLSNEAKAAIDRGITWLLAQQDKDGHWSNADFPALTALPLWALVKGGCTNTAAVDKAVQYILSCVHSDGSIWREPQVAQKGGGLANYNTAICMVALNLVGDPKLVPVVQKARSFVAATQHIGGDVYNGGMGYDPKTGKPYADLSNSYIAYEAMRLTQNVEDLRKSGDKKADLDWKAAQDFISRVQNMPNTNDPQRATIPASEKGGFAYKPDSSQAGTITNEQGEVRLRSYGSMTYAGLLSFIYADVNKEDPRVQCAFDWATRNWSLKENPGMGADGLYYFYNVLSKALSAFGQNQLAVKGGEQVNWRSDLVKQIVTLQKIEPKTGNGYWVNDAGRWWEADPVLATSYSLIALEVAGK